MIERTIEPILVDLALRYPVVTITGTWQGNPD